MSRRRAAVAGLVVAAAAVLAPPAVAGGERPTTSVGVRGLEFSLVLSRTVVHAGPAVVQFQNAGEDPHDLRMQRVGGGVERGTGEIGPGSNEGFRIGWLRRGARYRLWCSLPEHAELGMEATLRVRKRR